MSLSFATESRPGECGRGLECCLTHNDNFYITAVRKVARQELYNLYYVK